MVLCCSIFKINNHIVLDTGLKFSYVKVFRVAQNLQNWYSNCPGSNILPCSFAQNHFQEGIHMWQLKACTCSIVFHGKLQVALLTSCCKSMLHVVTCEYPQVQNCGLRQFSTEQKLREFSAAKINSENQYSAHYSPWRKQSVICQ